MARSRSSTASSQRGFSERTIAGPLPASKQEDGYRPLAAGELEAGGRHVGTAHFTYDRRQRPVADAVLHNGEDVLIVSSFDVGRAVGTSPTCASPGL